MKKLLSIFGMLMLLVNMVAAAVVITPDNPDTTDQLTCDVSGSAATYNYYWYVDGNRVKLETARSSRLAASQTNSGDEVICRAYRPSTPFAPETYVGRDAVTIQNNMFVPGMVIMQPYSQGYPDSGNGEGYQAPTYPDDGNGEAYVQPEYPDDGYGEEYIKPTYPDGGYGEAYQPREYPDDGYGEAYDVPQCNDNRDNDGDGFVDMNDPGCSSPQDDDEHNDVQNPACSDGVDNDNDGLIDMKDPGCDSLEDNSEVNAVLPKDAEVPSIGVGESRNLDLDMVYATVEGNMLLIDYMLENDGTMSVKGVELLISVPDYGITHIEDIGKLSVSRKIYGRASLTLPENAEGTHYVLVEAAGLGAHDSELRDFTVKDIPDVEAVVFEPEIAQEVHRGFFARILEWFLNLFRAIF